MPQPFKFVIDLFSSVRLGIVLLVFLFIYSSIGSAGILYPTSLNFFHLDNWEILFVRQWPIFEKTEFEWFNWWPFSLLIGLICANILITTVRRIRLSVINLGVWMIHSGIIILAIGSVWYFTAKVEGDTPVLRRHVSITLPDGSGRTLAALPGNRTNIDTDAGTYRFEVADINPEWELRSGDDAGKTAYSVSVRVTTPERSFIRQMLAGYPEYTEDVIPGEGRAINVVGRAIIDDTVSIALEHHPQRYFYLMQSDAVYLREVGQAQWVERPVVGLPKYNPYVENPAAVTPAGRPLEPGGIGIAVPAAREGDPIPDVTMRIASYLPWAVNQQTLAPGGSVLNPYLMVRLSAPGMEPTNIEMMAFHPGFTDVDPQIAQFRWISDESQRQALTRPSVGTLTLRVPEAGIEQSWPVDAFAESDGTFIEVGDSGYAIRVQELQENVQLSRDDPRPISFAIVDIRTPLREFNRWVFDDASRNRDQTVDPDSREITMIEFDDSIELTLTPSVTPPVLTFIAGPEPDRLQVAIAVPGVEPTAIELTRGSPATLPSGLEVFVERYWPRATETLRPRIVPVLQRTSSLSMKLRMIEVQLPGGEAPISVWLPFHDYPFADQSWAMRGFMHQPSRVRLSDGREIELLYSRRRAPLPAPVVLDDFVAKWHVGGFSGQNTSVQDWQSVIRFVEENGQLSERDVVAVNAPAEHAGYWFFQSMWDPPDPANGWAGMNFTGLGVGNREGVYVQLFGCALAVIGMIYAFYVKPVLKRRRRDLVHEQLRREAVARAAADRTRVGGSDTNSDIETIAVMEDATS